MVDLLVLIIFVAVLGLIGLLGWFIARLVGPILAVILAAVGLIGLIGFVIAVVVMSGGHGYKAMAPAPIVSISPCAAETPGPACDAGERERYLAALATQQLRDMPILMGWADELPWGRQTPITAVIASADRAAAKVALDNASAKNTGHVEEQTVAIGRKVRAELSGLDVEIDKPDQTRDVAALRNVTFLWHVKPTRPGRTTLTLRMFNQLITPDGAVELEQPALVREMSVKIGLLDWLTWQMDRMKGLQWLLGGLVAVLGAAFANRATLRRWWKRRQAAKAGATAETPPPPPAPPPVKPPGSTP